MQRLQVQLRFALDLDEPHGRPSRSLSDRFGIAVVVLVGFHVGAHILR
jgi:hypothetical protein